MFSTQRPPKAAQDPPHRRPKTPLNVIKGTLQNAALPANVSPSMTFAGSAAFCSVDPEAGQHPKDPPKGPRPFPRRPKTPPRSPLATV